MSLTGVAFSDSLPSGLKITSAANTSCTNGTTTGAVGGTSLSLSGATIAAGSTCVVTVGVQATALGSYTNTSGAVTATNSNAGGTATATLNVAVTATRLVYTSSPAAVITAGGNAGTFTVALEDAAGNIATNVSSGTITVSVSGNNYAQVYTIAISNGTATFNLGFAALTIAETYTYTATSSGLTNGVATEVVNPGPFSTLTGNAPTSFAAPGVASAFNVNAVDQYGNTVPGFTGTVTLTSSDPLFTASPASYTYTAADSGVHSFTVSFGTALTQTLTKTSGSAVVTQAGIVVNDCILYINSNGSLSRTTDVGLFTSPSGGYTGSGAPFIGLAVDASGDLWSVNTTNNTLGGFTKAGVALANSPFTGGGLNAPNAVFVDGSGFIWVVNGNNTVSVFNNAGVPVSSVAQPVAGTTGANAIAIDNSGNLWITGSTSDTLTEIIGGAAPVAPLANAAAAATTGARP